MSSSHSRSSAAPCSAYICASLPSEKPGSTARSMRSTSGRGLSVQVGVSTRMRICDVLCAFCELYSARIGSLDLKYSFYCCVMTCERGERATMRHLCKHSDWEYLTVKRSPAFILSSHRS